MTDSSANSDTNESEAERLSELYLFLALTVRYPDADFFSPEFLEAFEHLLTGFGLDKEQQQIHECRQDDDNLLQTLRLEYTRLFINATPHVIAPPYASIYMDGDHDLQGRTTEETRDFYRANGYDVTDTSDPADHIRFELEFLSALTRDGKFAEEEEFLKKLFRPWFAKFKAQLLAEPIHPYFAISISLIDFFTRKQE